VSNWWRAATSGRDGLEAPRRATFGGEIVDVIGDLTGTRRESALVIRPDSPWPSGTSLQDRQVLVRFESPLREPADEGWRVASTALLPDGLVRVDVQDHAPFATSWHQVTVLPADRPETLRTWRPMVDHGNSPWYRGLAIWVPERGRTYQIASTNAVGGGYGGDTLTVSGGANLAADGIRVGDWYVIYGVEPGRRVTVHNDLSWRREPSAAGQLYALRASGPATVRCAATAGALAWRSGAGAWAHAPAGRDTWDDAATAATVQIARALPAGLNLEDDAPPRLVRSLLDGRELPLDAALDLGWLEPPLVWELLFEDESNALDPASLTLRLNGQPVASPAATADGPGG